MSNGAQIAIGIGVVAVVGYFVIKKTTAPAAAPRGTAPAATTTSFVSGIVSGISGLASAFSSNKPNPTNTSGQNGTTFVPLDAVQGSAASYAYADEAGGVLPDQATASDYANENVVYGPFVN